MYADGHPSEEQAKRSILASADSKLGNFVSLGYVIQVHSNGQWAKTGQVKVMDMDAGREHHPWLILARDREWPCDDQEIADGDFYIHAEEVVTRADATVNGVLPW